MFWFLLIIAAFILQTNSDIFVIFNTIPNFFLIIVILFSLKANPFSGGFFGFLCGLIVDSIGTRHFGINALSFSTVGILVSIFKKKLYFDRLDVCFGIVFIATFIYWLIFLFFLLFLERYTPGPFYILKEGLYNGTIGCIIWAVIRKTNL